MSEQKFFHEYRRLNTEQKKAVDSIEGPVMVIAGPGTGKTQILTLRIANILRKTDTDPESILALTFTEAASANMRQRLVSVIGSSGYSVNIHTFHGFSNQLIQEYPEYFERITGFRNATELDRIDLVRSLINNEPLKWLKPRNNRFHYVLPIISAIKDIKKEGLVPEAFHRAILKERAELEGQKDVYHQRGPFAGTMKAAFRRQMHALERSEELAGLYQKYQEELRNRQLYDFEDMLLEVIHELLENETFRLMAQEKYQYVLVDEHQDTNGAQNKILALLMGHFPNPNLFVVGDEKQAIYRFQGANLANFLYFKDTFEKVKLITLTKNYRSIQPILDAAQSLIQHNKTPVLSPPLSAQHKKQVKVPAVKVYNFASQEAELLFLAERISALIEEGIPPFEIAILYRKNKDAFPIADFFERLGIPFVVESEQNILNDIEIRKLNTLLYAIYAFGDDSALIKALHVDFLNVDPLSFYALVVEAKKKRTSIHELLQKPLSESKRGHIHAVFEQIREWHIRSHNTNFSRFFEEIIREAGFLKHLLSLENRIEKLEKLSVLFDEIMRMGESTPGFSCADYLHFIRILDEHNLALRYVVKRQSQAVRLMTAHKAKGLEFDHVFIAGVYNTHWGNKRTAKLFHMPTQFKSLDSAEQDKNEDERRLFYMALTRARVGICVSYSRFSSDGSQRIPSQFIEEIGKTLKLNQEGNEYDFRAREKQHLLFAPKGKRARSTIDTDFVQERFSEYGLSPTALNNYLSCPWRYYFVNLMRLPITQTPPQLYGTAVHKALEKFFSKQTQGEKAGACFLVRAFEKELRATPLPEQILNELLEHGRSSLERYHAYYKDSWNYNTVNEFYISCVKLENEILLTGKLDKLELQDEKGNVIVVDYKTKKPESRNWIEGRTKNSMGNFKRQLVFYKLLLGNMPGKKYRMRAGEIDFTEPDDRGKFRKESFEISDEEVNKLRETIHDVAQEIRSLSFWDRKCEKKECEWCSLRNMMQ